MTPAPRSTSRPRQHPPIARVPPVTRVRARYRHAGGRTGRVGGVSWTDARSHPASTRKDLDHVTDTQTSMRRRSPRVGPTSTARRRHRPHAGRRRRPEGRQRPPRHGDEPGAGGLPAVPEGDAPQPRRAALARAATGSCCRAGTPASRSTSSSTSAVGAWSWTTSRRCVPGAPRPRATPSTATPKAWRSPPARSARASPTPWAWPWPPAASAACSTPTPPRASRSSTTTSTAWPPTATSRRASPPRRPRLPAPSGSAT